jgi:arylsulfatase A-like enzyme
MIMVDDLNDWVGAIGGHPQAQTPNLDRLISQGVLFSNAHCAAPVCGASRHALMSGLRPSTTGWYTGGAKTKESYERVLGETIPMPTHFKRNGYKTMAAGKVFHRGTSDVKDYEFWDEVRPKFKWPKKFIKRGHGYKGRHFYPFPRDGGGIYQLHQKGVDGHSLCWGALDKADIPDEGMPDEQIARWAVERLKQKHDKPFFLAVGFLRPHVPYTAPKEYFDRYPLEDVQMPKVPPDEMQDVPLFAKAMAYGTLDGGDHQNVLDAGPNYWREMVRAYLACTSFVDDQAGKVLEALDESPYADNTIVVFLSDHGQHLGEKMSWRKQDLWEEATRVPLSIRFPQSQDASQKYKGKTIKRASSLIDIYPTLIELCGLPKVKGLEGTSLTHRMADIPNRPFKPVVTTWHYKNHSVRGWQYRYTQYRDGTEELYDHRSDPGEHNNLAGDPKYAKTIAKYRRHLPKTNVVPASMKKGATDSFDKKVSRLESAGVPVWLGGKKKTNPAAQHKNGFTVLRDVEQITIQYDGKLVSRYHFRDQEARKPYFWPVIGPTGKPMTRAFPMENVVGEQQDHPHHRGLWFGHQGVGGSDMWLEAASKKLEGDRRKRFLATLGTIAHTGFDEVSASDKRAVIRSSNDYLDSGGKKLMADQRIMIFRMTGGNLVIDFDITLLPKYGDVELKDMKDAGLNVRVPTSMSLTAGNGQIINSLGDRDGKTWSKAANWVDYHGTVEGEHLGIAFLNHPSSFRHPTRWHVREYGLFTANAFGLKSLDPSALSGTFTLQSGQNVVLRHRLIFHKGDHQTASIAEAFKAYAAAEVGK